MSIFLIGAAAVGGILALALIVSLMFRRVVPTNMVHTVQSSKKTTSYGSGQAAGNVYYEWPASLPFIGVSVIKLPVTNFEISLDGYEAYDKKKVPFKVDITTFLQISDPSIAAQRIENFEGLKRQMEEVVRGAVRSVLAKGELEDTMLKRAELGQMFTAEVEAGLKNWGVETVRDMELMDIRDADGASVIHDIQAIEQSEINKRSRVEVARNEKEARVAEIDAQKETDIRQQEAELLVGQRTADKDKAVGIANEQAQQEIKLQQAETKERDMAVRRVEEVRQAEIDKDKAVVKAGQDRETTIIIAEGELEAERKAAEGVRIRGEADAEAKKLMELAPIQAQIELAKEIGENEGYQRYLIAIEAIAAQLKVGTAQAEALAKADVKVIANGASASDGVNSAAGILSSKTGTNMASLLESLSQSDLGKQLVEKLVGGATAVAASTPSAPTGGDNA